MNPFELESAVTVAGSFGFIR